MVVYDLAQAHAVWPVPSRFRTCTPRQWAKQGEADYPEQWTLARYWLSQFRRYLIDSPDPALCGHGLALVGETGVGKTMLACSFLNYLHNKGFSVAFVRDGELARILRVRYPTEEEEDLLGVLQRCACLVLDDMGRMIENIEIIEPFLRYRMDEAKPTIVTMNSAVALTATLGSLLHEFTYVVFEGTDRRVSPLEPGHAGW
jgi:DNA replication protein DnaC